MWFWLFWRASSGRGPWDCGSVLKVGYVLLRPGRTLFYRLDKTTTVYYEDPLGDTLLLLLNLNRPLFEFLRASKRLFSTRKTT